MPPIELPPTLLTYRVVADLFSDVYAVDCYESQFQGDIFSPQAGMAYRTKVGSFLAFG
jgi:hypothetical protein